MPDSPSPDFSYRGIQAIHQAQHAFRASYAGPWTVICDFDGTIADTDVTDALLARFALPEWEDVEAQWKAGEISARECMSRQIRMLRVTHQDLEAFLETISIDAGFREFIIDCRSRRLPVQVVSDGVESVIRSILRRHNLSQLPVSANQLISTGRNTYELVFPNGRNNCLAGSGTCKCAIASQGPRDSRVLLIGDGSSDFCLAGLADFVFSKGKLTRYCQDNGIAHRDFDCFNDVRFLLSELLDHPNHHIHRIPMPWSTTR